MEGWNNGTFEQTCLRKPHSLSRLSRIIGELDSGSGLWEGLWERIILGRVKKSKSQKV